MLECSWFAGYAGQRFKALDFDWTLISKCRVEPTVVGVGWCWAGAVFLSDSYLLTSKHLNELFFCI